jgi:hypothetical protein
MKFIFNFIDFPSKLSKWDHSIYITLCLIILHKYACLHMMHWYLITYISHFINFICIAVFCLN